MGLTRNTLSSGMTYTPEIHYGIRQKLHFLGLCLRSHPSRLLFLPCLFPCSFIAFFWEHFPNNPLIRESWCQHLLLRNSALVTLVLLRGWIVQRWFKSYFSLLSALCPWTHFLTSQFLPYIPYNHLPWSLWNLHPTVGRKQTKPNK